MSRLRKIIITVLLLLSINQLKGYTHEVKRIFQAGTNQELSLDKEIVFEELQKSHTEYKEELLKIRDELSSEQIVKLNDILENRGDVPENVLELALKNPETINFAHAYTNFDRYERIEITKEESVDLDRKIPLYLQWDTRWGYDSYGNGIMALSGCAPTSLSMVISGLNQDAKATPDVIAKLSAERGYITNGSFTSWELMSKGGEDFGIVSREISLSEEAMKNELSNGNPLILSMKPGQFTTVGHMLVLVGVSDNGEFILNDANSIKHSKRTWKFNELKGDIRNIWAYSIK